MKLYFIVALVIAAVHMGLAGLIQPNQRYGCPGKKTVLSCPHDDPSHCAVYCSLLDDQDNPVLFGYLCRNTHPMMFCASADQNFCTTYCQGAARATSLPVAGWQNHNPDV